MATIIATGRISHPEKLTPEGAALENEALAVLSQAGTVREAFIHDERTAITLLIDADSVGAAEEALSVLPLVKARQLELAYTLANDLLHHDKS